MVVLVVIIIGDGRWKNENIYEFSFHINNPFILSVGERLPCLKYRVGIPAPYRDKYYIYSGVICGTFRPDIDILRKNPLGNVI